MMTGIRALGLRSRNLLEMPVQVQDAIFDGLIELVMDYKYIVVLYG
jgi:hypothetical protein